MTNSHFYDIHILHEYEYGFDRSFSLPFLDSLLLKILIKNERGWNRRLSKTVFLYWKCDTLKISLN